MSLADQEAKRTTTEGCATFWSMSCLSFSLDQSTTSPRVKVREKIVLYTKLTTICYYPAQASAV